MWKLIYYEAKKLIQSKSGCIILLLFLAICCWQMKDDLEKEPDNSLQYQLKAEGSYNTLLERLALPDISKDRTTRNPDRPLHEDRMKNMYGDQWEAIITALENHTLTYEQYLNSIKGNADNNQQEAQLLKEAFDHLELQYFYQDDELQERVAESLPNIELLLHRENYLYTKENRNTDSLCILGTCRAVQDEVTRQELNRRFLALDDEYHAAAGASLISGVSSYTNFILLIVMAILLGNIYSKEVSNKTDIYLTTSSMGGRRSVIAKLLLTLIIGFVIPMLCKLITVFLLIQKVGPFDWSMVSYGAGTYIASYIFTFKELIGYGLCNYAIGLIALCVSFLFISMKSKNSYVAGVVCMLFVILPIYYEFFAMEGIHAEQWLPSNLMMRFDAHFTVDGLYRAFDASGKLFISVFGMVVPEIFQYWLAWLVVLAVLITLMCWEAKRHLIHHA